MEEQVILRLPPDMAAAVREMMNKQELPNDALEVKPGVDPNNARICEFVFMGKSYPAKLCDLPCIIEAQKTFDRAAYYKSGDICQILIVRNPEDPEPPDLLSSGLTPPTHLIREKRFRKHPFTKKEVQDAEAKLLAIMEGRPQVTYELIEQEEEVEETESEIAASELASGNGISAPMMNGVLEDDFEDDFEEEEEAEEEGEMENIENGMEEVDDFEMDGIVEHVPTLSAPPGGTLTGFNFQSQASVPLQFSSTFSMLPNQVSQPNFQFSQAGQPTQPQNISSFFNPPVAEFQQSFQLPSSQLLSFDNLPLPQLPQISNILSPPSLPSLTNSEPAQQVPSLATAEEAQKQQEIQALEAELESARTQHLAMKNPIIKKKLETQISMLEKKIAEKRSSYS
eukprot:TRINITY_DN38220_c0_g1_i1.p2 TRINITY_DN38220_c0_g1~~TRINITY_DN38220_c0_g1_i1.p2  ORF type:complete len:408 (-),score=126.38 TRINITY_DN38220_c0_g1_i1:1892-3082(-)